MDRDPFKGGGLTFYFLLPLQQKKTQAWTIYEIDNEKDFLKVILEI
jgi:hypothetical protein